jgi:hypothetical protein
MSFKELTTVGTSIFSEEHRQVFTLVFLFMGSVWGATVKYLAHIKENAVDFSLYILASEAMAHSFSGMLAYFTCRGFHINEDLTIVITLVSAYMGLKILNKLENELIENIDLLSEWVKRKF